MSRSSGELSTCPQGRRAVDRDGRVTYAELGAFLRTANASIANERFRPDFVVRPPGHPHGNLAQSVLSWQAEATTLLVDDPTAGHLYIETPDGERLLDAHARKGHLLALRLSAARPLFVRRSDSSVEQQIVSRAATVHLSEISPGPVSVAQKGAVAFAFEDLFSVPFGQQDVQTFRTWYRNTALDSPTAELKMRRGDEVEPGASSSARQTVGTVAGWTAIGAATQLWLWLGL